VSEGEFNLESRAKRFINCYNQIDQALRMQGDISKSISYTEVIRKASRTNAIVKKYEDALIDYGRLRNAIVHSADNTQVIAEPNQDVVDEFEKICSLICTPPLAVDTICNKNFASLQSSEILKDVVEYIYQSGYSSIPIYRDSMLIGVANATKITRLLGKKIYQKVDINKYLEETTMEVALKELIEDNYYTIANEKTTLDKIMQLFAENRKLLLIVITKNGTLLEKPIGIVTAGDIMEINKILDNYIK